MEFKADLLTWGITIKQTEHAPHISFLRVFISHTTNGHFLQNVNKRFTITTQAKKEPQRGNTNKWRVASLYCLSHSLLSTAHPTRHSCKIQEYQPCESA